MKRLSLWSAFSLLAIGSPVAVADVKLPAVLGSHMVVQRDQPLSVWGWAEKGEEVSVKFGEGSASAKADDKGNWKVVLPAPKLNAKARGMLDRYMERGKAFYWGSPIGAPRRASSTTPSRPSGISRRLSRWRRSKRRRPSRRWWHCFPIRSP